MLETDVSDLNFDEGSQKQPSHNDLQWINQSKRVFTPTSATYTVDDRTDIVVCTATCTVTLPIAKRGREIIVQKSFAGGYINILPTSTDTLVGTTAVQILVDQTSLHFKAVAGGYILI